MSATTEFDTARLEWEFEKLRNDHRGCCAGALLLHQYAGAGSWLNVIVPVRNRDGTLAASYRGWDDDWPRERNAA